MTTEAVEDPPGTPASRRPDELHGRQPVPPHGRSTATEAARPQAWRRLALAHALQIPAVAAVVITPAAWLPSALWASAVCCLLTDSGWRWRNRLLVAEAVVWLTCALSTIP